ncbi:YheC/YheD family protein [Alkalihalobacillus macyae]|uniref:YheC/YheD family endospore coat-associated protein n=1 Tax=Guptibacillus hwajinpoensis TaxID=208199 RepID=UPI00273B8037|nr:YheC/YheD family protein [Alkalihalobacillus macyae]MDP4551709.1 YheC/YheD family protein [Alkalihalobacillus macyae]
MIELFYDDKTNNWHQKSTYQFLYWGKEQKRLAPLPSSSIPSIITLNSNKTDAIRPLVGILAGSNSSHHFSGNASIFKSIQKEIRNTGGLSYVFTPNDVYRTFIKGYLYDPIQKKWTGYRFPYPNIVYNRIPDRKEEQTKKVALLFNLFSQKGIPYFNRSFFQKDAIISHLTSDAKLTNFIPETEILTIKSFQEYLQRYPSVFCKPSSGSKGRGIFKVKKTPTGYQYIDHESTHSFTSIDKLYDHIHIQESYMIQRDIQLDTYENHPYDFRILVQKPLKSWNVTGIGIRAAQDGGLTTHVPRGGRIIPFHKLATDKDKAALTQLAIMAAEVLEEETKMSECSMDIGKDSDGHFWIFEANSKPMRFDEPDIHRDYIQSLIASFRTFSAF